jgi:hypothetical protein
MARRGDGYLRAVPRNIGRAFARDASSAGASAMRWQ